MSPQVALTEKGGDEEGPLLEKPSKFHHLALRPLGKSSKILVKHSLLWNPVYNLTILQYNV
jgi:hypothetical protein